MKHKKLLFPVLGLALILGLVASGCSEATEQRTVLPNVEPSPTGPLDFFVNWETPHVHPLDITPDGARLLAVNTPDNRLEVFRIASHSIEPLGAISVGLDPVSVRARTNSEAWVVNHISDTVSIVDLDRMSVVKTLWTADEPADVIFAGGMEKAFVSCSQVNQVIAFDLTDLEAEPEVIQVEGEDPKAMALSSSGDEVYVAVFESGNGSTIISGDSTALPTPIDDYDSPHGGLSPPPNSGDEFYPAINPDNPTPPEVSLIVKKDSDGRWMDDNGGDWSEYISGNESLRTERVRGWDLPDRDLAIIDAQTLDVRYARRIMNINMALAVNPGTGLVTLVGTDATNEVRFEPNLNGRFLRVNLGMVEPQELKVLSVVDLNPHLDYAGPTIPQSERNRSLGDPRGIVWNTPGTRGYVTGMGSNNVVVIDETGARIGSAPISVGEGPTGIALDESRQQLYVLNKFESAISVIDVKDEQELARVPFFDPSPPAIKAGRRHLYNTHDTSGLGHVSCASCHVDARMDRLAWDLGNPAGLVKDSLHQNLGRWHPGLSSGFEDWHPMKGPMITQTLQDIIGKEPFHWRGDRDGLEEFNAAFLTLLGDDEPLTTDEMQEFEDFLRTIYFPPNPFRNFDNTLPDNVSLEGHFAVGRFGVRGSPLPDGNAQRGLELFLPPKFADTPFSCSTCHTLPSGIGPNIGPVVSAEIPPGPNGDLHHGLVSVDGANNVTLKIVQLRNIYERVGFDTTQKTNLVGFGFAHDGAFDSLPRFFRLGFDGIDNMQELADIIAFLMAFSGSDLPAPKGGRMEPPGPPSLDAHAAVGKQITVADGSNLSPAQSQFLANSLVLAPEGRVDLVAKGVYESVLRGYTYVGANQFQSDQAGDVLEYEELLARAAPGNEITFTVVPVGYGNRIGIDRDWDGVLDGDKLAMAAASIEEDTFAGWLTPALGGVCGGFAIMLVVLAFWYRRSQRTA